MRRFIVVPMLAFMLAFALGSAEAQPTCNLCNEPTRAWMEPQVISSSGGVLNYTLEAKFVESAFGGIMLRHRSYNGLLTGPTFRFKAGDTLNILLKNNLPVATDRSKKFNVTNLHTHGFHVSPKCDPDNLTGPWNWCSDNVLITIEPQTEVQFKFELPEDHPPGTHWYHPHHHGATAVQVTSGMSGALLLEGNVDVMLRERDISERLFVFQQIQYNRETREVSTCYDFGDCELLTDDFGSNVFDPTDPSNPLTFIVNTSINGVLKPLISLRPGQIERWRFIHAGIKGALNVTLVPAKRGQCNADYNLEKEALPLNEFAADGITMGRIAKRSLVPLFPGYRSDVLVQINEPGVYCLLDYESTPGTLNLFGKAEVRQVLAMVVVNSMRPVEMEMPTSDDFKPLAPYASLCGPETKINARQAVTFAKGWSPTGGPESFFNVNGVVFPHHVTPTTPRLKLKLNNTDEWTLMSGVDNHSFHIHQNPFEVCGIIDINTDQPARFADGTPAFDGPIWRDTLIVPLWQRITMRTHYKEFTGAFVQHCHILTHEDLGMMQLIEIEP